MVEKLVTANEQLKSQLEEIVVEVGERKNAEKKLRASEEQFRLLFEKAPIGMVLTDIEGEIQNVNSALCNILEYSKEELLDIPLSDITCDEVKFSESEYRKDLMNGENESILIEKKFITQSENLIITLFNVVVLKDRNLKPYQFLGQIVDITQLKNFQKELVIAKERAEESDRLKSAFLAQMSHEIRTPINTVLNFNSLIREELGDDISDDIRESFQVIDSGSRRLIRTIDSVLNMSQLQAGSFEVKLEIIDLYEDVLKDLFYEFKQPAESKNLKYAMEIESKKPFIWGDKYSLTQMCSNLIDNAVKYTNSGGILVRLRDVNEREIMIEFLDSGIGISEQYLTDIFEPFSQEDVGYTRRFEGNGLGLALAKNYIDLNKGAITVKTRKNVGSKFMVTIERATEKAILKL